MPISIGIGLSLTGLGSPRKATPVIDWISGASDTTPNFNFDLSFPVVNDVIYLQYSSTSNFSSITESLSNTLDQTEIDTLTVDFNITTLTTGTYYFRAAHNNSAWSATETVTISSGGSPIGLLLILTN